MFLIMHGLVFYVLHEYKWYVFILVLLMQYDFDQNDLI